MNNENTGWAVGYYSKMGWGHLPIINRTTDGGLTWQNVYVNRYPGPTDGEEFTDIRFKNELEGFALSSFMESVFTVDGGQTWQLTYDDEGKTLIPGGGIYKTLAGNNYLYLAGRNGCVTKWE